MTIKRGELGGPIMRPDVQRESESGPGLTPVLQKTEPALQPQAAPVLRTPTTVRMTAHAVAPTPAPQREPAPVMLKRLEPLIQAQVQEILAALEKEHLKPEDVQATVAFNTVGRQEQVCSYCGRHGCGYRPVMYAKQNAEIELLEDDFTVSTQALARAGVSYAGIVYDEDVLVLREMGPPGEAAKTAGDLELELQRFRAFKNRRSYPDPANRAWLDQMLAKWRPEHAYAPVVGQANDLGMLETTRKIFASNPGRGGPKFFVMATSVAPSTALAGQEFGLKKMGVLATALAVGKNAEAIAPDLFEETAIVHDAHSAREMIGDRIATLVKMAGEQEVV